MKFPISLTLNGRAYQREVEPRQLLVHLIRDLGTVTGTKIGCDTSQCGACTVLLDGVAIKSCTALAVQTDGASVTTIEGLANGETLHPPGRRCDARKEPHLCEERSRQSGRARSPAGRQVIRYTLI